MINGVSMGLVIDLTEVIFAISLAALIFYGNDSYIANGIGLILLGAIPAFHQLITQFLAERTTHLIRTVAALEK